MDRRMWCGAGIGLLAVLLMTGPAAAQISYQFADATGAPRQSFSAAAGSMVSIRVYLVDSSPGAMAFNSNGGLGSAGVRVTYNTPAAGVADTTASNITLNTAPAPTRQQFASGSATADASSATVSLLSPLSRGVFPDADGRILLATFTLTGRSGGSVNLVAMDPNTAAQFDTSSFDTDPVTFFPLVDYDPIITPAMATLSFTPVPEPSTALLTGGAGLAGWAGFRRRKRVGG